MGASAIEQLHTSSDAPAEEVAVFSAPSAGRADARWIQAPLARIGFTTIRPAIVLMGSYSISTTVPDSGTEQSEIAQLRLAAATSFLAFEASLPENED